VQSDLLLPRLLIRVHVCYCTACFLSSLIKKQEPLHVTLLSYALSSLLYVIRHVGYKTSWHGGSAGRRRICWTSWGHTSRIDSRCWHGQRKKQTKHSFSRNVGLPAKEVNCPPSDCMIERFADTLTPYWVILTYIPPILMSCRSSAKEVRLQGKASGRRSSSNQQEKWTRCLQPHQPFLFFFAARCLYKRVTPSVRLQFLCFQGPQVRNAATFGQTPQPSQLDLPRRDPVLLFSSVTTLPA